MLLFKQMIVVVVAITFLASGHDVLSNDEVRIRQPQSRYDASHDYYVGLLKMALTYTEVEYGKGSIAYSSNINQGRELEELEKGDLINVIMVGTNQQRESKFIPIRIPLNKGLLGKRLFIIRKEKISSFDGIDSIEKLKQFKACQGRHWPDSDIMESAGLPVIRNQDYEGMFAQLNYGRCDYFPRGINEGYSEVEARHALYPNLVLYEKLVLSYEFPMYFFVSPRYPELAKRLEKGLMTAVDNGAFDRYFRSNKITSVIFPLEKWKNTLEIKINNPFLPEKTPFSNKKLWLDLPLKR